MIKRVLGICFTAAAFVITGKMISDYAETKPALKNVKDKLKKTGQIFLMIARKLVWQLNRLL